MARPGPQTHKKRQRELAKQEKRKLKAERRVQRKEQKALEAEQAVDSEIDSDLAGIVPGPQKPLY